MKSQLVYFDIYPKVVPCRRKTTVHIKPLSKHVRFDLEQYYVHIIPADERTLDVYHPQYPVLTVKPTDGSIAFNYVFEREESYTILVADQPVAENSREAWAKVRCEKFFLYAVEDDLLRLRPYKGNMHVHSFRSDGVEAPEIVAAAYRHAGYDYLAITDHALFEPSLEAIDAYRDVPLNMRLFTGEEVHSPDNLIHIIHFAGDYSINNLYREQEPEYRAAVENNLKTMDIPEGLYAYEIAACKWVFDEAKKTHGLSILCHPNWTWYGAYNIPLKTYKYFMEHKDYYDVLELINGGNEPHENQLQVNAWYNFGDSQTRPVVVGTDDSHGSVNGKWFDIGNTYVLSASLEREDLLSSLRGGLCGAVEQYHGQAARIYGQERIVRYLTFLDMEYFPLHDALCQEEGRLMAAYVNGDGDAKARLTACVGQIDKLLCHLFAKV